MQKPFKEVWEELMLCRLALGTQITQLKYAIT